MYAEVLIEYNSKSVDKTFTYIVPDKMQGIIKKGRSFSDYAILYRMNAQANSIQTEFAKSGIPERSSMSSMSV